MALGEGMSCVKYLLFCFNLLFAITGLIILIAGGIVEYKSNLQDLIHLTEDNFYQMAPVVLMIVGFIIFVVAFFGCCGAVKENHCMVVTFSVFLIIIFLAELAVGIAGYVKHSDLEANFQKTLNSSITNYEKNPEAKKLVDILQTDLQCCGVYSYSDWTTHGIPIPASCCSEQGLLITGEQVAPAACAPDSDHFHSKPCLSVLVDNANLTTLVLGGVGVGIALVQLIGVMFACCLARSIRSQYETV